MNNLQFCDIAPIRLHHNQYRPRDMHELPIVILSKELKYSLALEKVKTLEKAVELLPKLAEIDPQKADKIRQLDQKYRTYEEMVRVKFNILNGGSPPLVKGEQTESAMEPLPVVSLPLYSILTESGITQIAGAKGAGKTCLLLHLAEEFIRMYGDSGKQVSVTILNCAAGITQKRMERLLELKEEKKVDIEYYDIGNADDAYVITEKLLKKSLEAAQSSGRKDRKVLVVIDSLVTLLLPREKSKPVVSRLMKNFKLISSNCLCVALFSNFIQHKFQIGHEELYNHASYHAQITGQYLTCKLYAEKPDKSLPHLFRVASVKGKSVRSLFQIGENGIQKIEVE